MTKKNIAESRGEVLLETKDFLLTRFMVDRLDVTQPLSNHRVHFFFCTRGDVEFAFSEHYKRVLQKGDFFTIYDQQRDLQSVLSSGECKMIYLALAPSFIHDIFIEDNHNLVHFEFDGFGVREYAVKPIDFESDQLLDTFFRETQPTALKSVYYKAKILELLSYCFDVPTDSLYEACPFLKEKDNVEKIKLARNILIDRMNQPPSLKELAKEIGMNEYNLKIGFRSVYGLPPFRYLQEHKLTHSKHLLKEGQMQVSEVAYAVGYKSASHYIEAFRKKFGNTPRKFMMSSLSE